MKREKQRRVLDVERGLFLVEYATAADESDPPKISLAADAESQQALQLLLPPGETEATLWRPGACLVLRATAPGKLIVEVEPLSRTSSAFSTVRVEPLSVGRAAQPGQTGDSGEPLDLTGFTLIGHIAGRGDVQVKADEWLAGPSAPSRIEGVAIAWRGKPVGVDMRYLVNTARPQAISQRPLNIGEFAGTRGKALPLVGVAFEVIGDAASKIQLAAEAIFLGSPASRAVGRRVSLSGPTGREPLVGLKLTLEKTGGATTRPVERDNVSRVRVFRGRGESEPDQASPRRRSGRTG
jgi:hypothetical protein